MSSRSTKFSSSSGSVGLPPLLCEAEFGVVAQDYQRMSSFALLLVDPTGRVLCGGVQGCDCLCGNGAREVFAKAVQDAWRWGESRIHTCCSGGHGVWAVPVMLNEHLLGGLVGCGVGSVGEQFSRFEDAAMLLYRVAVERNLTNSAFLERRREQSRRERMRSESLKSAQSTQHDNLRQSYLQEEPSLLEAIRVGDRRRARQILNKLLVGIYYAADRRMDLLKSYAIELVSMMCRAAVEAGGAPGEILGANYASIAQLDGIEDDEAMAEWLTAMLENLMDAIRDNVHYSSEVLVDKAIQYMREHLHEDLHREGVARYAGLSSSHFARLIKAKTGLSYTDTLVRVRVNKACQRLRCSDDGLIKIASDCGFFDQSHFSRTFKKLMGKTPGQYRSDRR